MLTKIMNRVQEINAYVYAVNRHPLIKDSDYPYYALT